MKRTTSAEGTDAGAGADMGAGGPARMPRLAGLDGVKGFALIAVVLYHCMQSTLPGGFYGVDVFLTVSGFLAALGLCSRFRAGASLADELPRYWPRRVMRLYPALCVMVPAVLLLADVWNRDALVGVRDQVLTAFLGCYNWYAVASGKGYFEQMNPQLLRHLWFTSVLLQWYLLTPLLAYAMHRLSRRCRNARVAALLPAVLPALPAVASMLLMRGLYVPGSDPTRVYFGTDTHASGFLLGVAFAWPVACLGERWCPMWWRRFGPAISCCAWLSLVALMAFGRQDDAAFRWGVPLASVLSVVFMAGVVAPDSWMRPRFEFRPLAALGRRSYGVYLWHWPLWLVLSPVVSRLASDGGPLAFVAQALGRLDRTVLAYVLVACACAMALSSYLAEHPVSRYGVLGAFVPDPGCSMVRAMRSLVSFAVALFVVSGGVAAVLHAPARTAVEESLERQAAALDAGRDLPRAQVPPPARPPHEMPSGDRLTMVGDSVMLAGSAGLSSVFAGADIDAQVSRSSAVGVEIVERKASDGSLRQWVVAGVFTNGPIADGQLDRLLAACGEERVLVLVNAHGDRAWIPENNRTLSDFAAAHQDRVVLADWEATAGANAGHLAADGIHPDASDVYASAVDGAIRAWIAAGH